jgi:hypothetical protein
MDWMDESERMDVFVDIMLERTKTSLKSFGTLVSELRDCYGGTKNWINFSDHDGDMAICTVSFDDNRIDLWRSHCSHTYKEGWYLWYADFDSETGERGQMYPDDPLEYGTILFKA